jgi:RHH-type transcriptional regulator, rel operon repressor / antitoxin RelB
MAQAGSTTMTLRLEAAMRKRLEKLSKATARSKSFLAQEAIRAYVELQEWQVEAIHEGLRDADEAKFVDGELVDEWLETWGRPKEKRPPR